MMMTNDDRERLETIYVVMNRETFGQRTSARIVGGMSRLMKLITDGRIRAGDVGVLPDLLPYVFNDRHGDQKGSSVSSSA